MGDNFSCASTLLEVYFKPDESDKITRLEKTMKTSMHYEITDFYLAIATCTYVEIFLIISYRYKYFLNV